MATQKARRVVRGKAVHPGNPKKTLPKGGAPNRAPAKKVTGKRYDGGFNIDIPKFIGEVERNLDSINPLRKQSRDNVGGAMDQGFRKPNPLKKIIGGR
jgi:hypothetical protein